MRLTFLGSGDAFGNGGRFNTCLLVQGAGERFLIDCGATALVAMKRFGVDPNGIGTILVSHLHGDHFGGLPFLLLDAQFGSRRRAPLTIAGPPSLRDRLDATMECLFPGAAGNAWRFPLEIVELEEETPWRHGGLVVTPYRVVHACGAPPFALRVAVGGRTLAYTGDTEWTEALVPACRSADLMIAEAYFRDRATRYHLDLATLEAHLPRIAPKRLVLTHMSPDMLGRGDALPYETATDGMTIEF